MGLQKKRPATVLQDGTGHEIDKLTGYRGPENSKPALEVQTEYLCARYGLDATRARLTAELAWGCR